MHMLEVRARTTSTRMCRPRSNAIDRLLDEIFDHTPEHPRPTSRVIQVSVERPEHWAQLEPIGNVRDDRSHHLNLQTNELQVKPSPATDWHSICKVSPGPGETARVAALVDGVKVKDGTTRLASGFAVLLQPGDTFVYHAPTRMEWMYQVDDQHVTRSYSGGRPVSKRLCCHGGAEHDIPTQRPRL